MITLTNVGTTYDAIPASKGLGFLDIDFTGVVQIAFRCRWNKIGTGTLSWQLWSDTDGSEIARIDDAAAAADNRTSTVTVNASKIGVHSCRVRAKSTVATDDPVFYGFSVREVRV